MNAINKPDLENETLQQLADQVEAREFEKEQKKLERKKNQRQKLVDKQKESRDRLVAPVLLIISLIVSALLWAIRELN